MIVGLNWREDNRFAGECLNWTIELGRRVRLRHLKHAGKDLERREEIGISMEELKFEDLNTF